MQAILGGQKLGASWSADFPCVHRWKLRLLALREQRNVQNTEFGEERSFNIQRCRSLSERVGLRIIVYYYITYPMNKVQARSHDVTNEPCTSPNYENIENYDY